MRTLQALAGATHVQQLLLGYSQDEDGAPSAWPPDSSDYYLVQELGTQSLQAFLAAEAARGCWSPMGARAICADVLRALAGVHALGLAHMDVKPSNIVFSRRTSAWALIDMDSCRPLVSVISAHVRCQLSRRYARTSSRDTSRRVVCPVACSLIAPNRNCT